MTVNIVYARTAIVGPRPWIFLAGPTTRDPINVPSWRVDAVGLADKMHFGGTLLIPEDGPGREFNESMDSQDQVYWEWDAIDAADIVMFWVPRDLVTMPGLTTNTEFGYLVSSGRVVLGTPADAPKNDYLRMLAKRHDVPIRFYLSHTLEESFYLAEEKNAKRRHTTWPSLNV